MSTISGDIRKIIENSEAGTLFSAKDFVSFMNDTAVNKILNRLVGEGVLEKVTTGIFSKPVVTRFGSLKPTLYEVAQKIADKYDAKILPTGPTALNIVGLSTQVPMNAVFWTSGSTREVPVGNRKIIFKHVVEKNFLLKGKLLPIIIVALREIGPDGMNDEIYAHIKALIAASTEEDKETLIEDARLAPADWIRRVFDKIIKELGYGTLDNTN